MAFASAARNSARLLQLDLGLLLQRESLLGKSQPAQQVRGGPGPGLAGRQDREFHPTLGRAQQGDQLRRTDRVRLAGFRLQHELPRAAMTGKVEDVPASTVFGEHSQPFPRRPVLRHLQIDPGSGARTQLPHQAGQRVPFPPQREHRVPRGEAENGQDPGTASPTGRLRARPVTASCSCTKDTSPEQASALPRNRAASHGHNSTTLAPDGTSKGGEVHRMVRDRPTRLLINEQPPPTQRTLHVNGRQ